MQTAILTLHVLVCLILVILVLLQAGREGMGVIFGGGGNSSVFGSVGAGGVLVKLTAFMAVLFIVTSLGYNILTSSTRDQGSSFLDVQFEEPVAPVVPDASSETQTPAEANAVMDTTETDAPEESAAETDVPDAPADAGGESEQ